MKAYLSYLRIFATFSVVVLHVAAFYVLKFENYQINIWKTAHFVDSLVRFCVPVFLMISGALLLDKEESLSVFLSKRFKRILIPFLFWSIIYFVYLHQIEFSTKPLLQIFKDFYFGFMEGISYHFWYVYLILGVYLFVPILRMWSISASNKELLYFLGIWSFTLFINPTTSKYFPQIELLYFSKYIGYLVLGLYFSRLEFKSVLKIRLISILLFFIGFLITYFFTISETVKQARFDGFYYEYLSPNIVLMASGVFLLFKTSNLKTNSISILIDKNTFGIYLCHILILKEITHLIPDAYFLNSAGMFFFYLILISVLVFLSSFLSIFLLSKLPMIKKWIT